MTSKQALGTITGELFQPVRLHYQVFDADGLAQKFTDLGCLRHDPPRERWTWLYDHEAKGLKFA